MWKDYLDKGKGLFDKSKCLLGFHQGTWEFRSAADCTQVQACEKCGIESHRVEHQWGEWNYRAEGSCDLVRICGRCAQTEHQIKHVWGEPRYTRPGACDRVAACSRCGDEEGREATHDFNRWEYQNQDDCTQVEACSRCAQHGRTTRTQHDWEGWIDSAFYQSRVRVCRHCGQMLVDAPGLDGTAPTSMQAVEAAIDRVAGAASWEEIRRHLHADHSTLLSPIAEKYFQFAFAHYSKDESVSKPLEGAHRIVTRCREVGIDRALQELGGLPAQPPHQTESPGAPGAAPASPAGPLDQRLIGHWRSTECMPSGGSGITMITDTHCFLDRYGDFAFWSVTRSSFGDSDSDRKMGTWEARDGRLLLNFQAGGSWSKHYLVEGDKMTWRGDGRYPFWEMV